jgi:hypothetical protein
VSRFDEIWSGSAQRAAEGLPPLLRDQAEALVRHVCRDPLGPDTAEHPQVPRTRVARAGRLAVYYQVDEIGEMVYVVGVEAPG